jgi:hypothetical protein
MAGMRVDDTLRVRYVGGMLIRLSFAVASLSLVLGCSSLNPLPEKQASCDLRPAEDQCTDLRKYKGATLATFQGVCGTLTAAKPGAAGYKEDATCPVTAMLGGCQADNGDGSLQTNWYYTGKKYKTADDVKMQCGSGQTFAAPQ